MARNNLSEVDDIDVIMAEMEAKTPKPEDKEKSFEKLFNGTAGKLPAAEEKVVSQVPDVVDARGFWNSSPKRDRPGKNYPSKPTNERYYDFTNARVGAALIFNQMKIKGELERKGSQKDADDLCRVLFEIGFDVKVRDDFTTREVKDELDACNTILWHIKKPLLSNFISQYQNATIPITIVCWFAS